MASYFVILSSLLHLFQCQITELELQSSLMPIGGNSWATYYQSSDNKIWLLSPLTWISNVKFYLPIIISYDIDNDIFETLPNISNPQPSMNGWSPRYFVAVGDDIYFNGDTGAIRVYNINDDTTSYIDHISWRQSCLATDGRFVFFIGGERLDSVSGVIETAAYDTSTDIWYYGNYQSYFMRRFPCEIINGVIYTFGGNNGRSQDYISKLIIGTGTSVINNYRNNQWLEAGNLIISRGEHNTAVCDSADGSLVYIIGGVHASDAEGTYKVLDIEIYDVDTEKTQLTSFSLNEERHNPAVMCVGQHIYIFGGIAALHLWEKAKVATQSPTVSPTKKPTISPTSETDEPTNNPTLKPTNTPTISPSSKTDEPTNNPTFVPTDMPTLSPTKEPTSRPTNMPSLTPTSRPTNIPSLSPTNMPSLTPTSRPTNVPSLSPTKEPSLPPTNIPSLSPTKSPTLYPTNIPTLSPTKFPTLPPTNMPSFSPSTNMPSLTPSKHPSILSINVVVPQPSAEYTELSSSSSTVFVPTKHAKDSVKKEAKKVDALIVVFCIIIVVTFIAIVVFSYRVLKLRKQVSVNRNQMITGQKTSANNKQREKDTVVIAKSQKPQRKSPQRKRTISLSLSSSSSSELYDTYPAVELQTSGAKVEKEIEGRPIETAGEGLEGCSKNRDNNSNITAILTTGSHDNNSHSFQNIINVKNVMDGSAVMTKTQK